VVVSGDRAVENNTIFIMLMKAAPALAAGCTVVPSRRQGRRVPRAPWQARGEAGFPPAGFNVPHGTGMPWADCSFQASRRGQGVGSPARDPGTSVMKDAAEHIAQVTLELGSPRTSLFADADIGRCRERRGVQECSARCGQMCISTAGRMLGQRSHPRRGRLPPRGAHTL